MGKSKDIAALIVENLVAGLPTETPDNIFIYGGGKIRKKVSIEMSSGVNSNIIEGPSGVNSNIIEGPSGSVYVIDLEYFVRLYGEN